MRVRLLTPEEIAEAKLLKQRGYSKRQLAHKFEVGEMTIWENVYSERDKENEKRRSRFTSKIPAYTYRKIPIVIRAVCVMKKYCENSQQVAKELDMPLKEVNYIWAKHV